MLAILVLLLFPLVVGGILLFTRGQKSFAYIIRTSSICIIALSIFLIVKNFETIYKFNLSQYEFVKYIVLAIEILISLYIIYIGIKNKSYLVSIFSGIQILVLLWFEFSKAHEIVVKDGIYIDRLSLLMIGIIGIVGSLICIYSIEYMKDYQHEHAEIKDRRPMFYSVLFIFLSAMFGLVIFNDMSLMLFCWEITSFCSFLLIGYSKTKEAIQNSFLALVINVGGGLCFLIGMVIIASNFGIMDFNTFLSIGRNSKLIEISVFLMIVAGLTKSAQMPFSKWLLGAMVAPTPTSAILHSSTMVKAGVYLIIRLAPMLGKTPTGITVTVIGGITFFVAALMAVTQSDAKKILAYSTISNLGLIVACAGINTAEALWAAIMLIVFHAIAKSLLFLSVGSTEHQIGSRNVEDMDGLFKISNALAMFLIIGIAGMFVAPFGMLISKWAAMKAFLDSGNILIILFLAYGSTVTLFFWTKWMGKLLANAHIKKVSDYVMMIDEKISLYSLSAMVIIVCAVHPLISRDFVTAYINSNMHISFVSPIDRIDTTIIMIILLIFFILPIILVPLYRRYRVKPTSVYLSGQNTGDNESFYGSMGEVRQMELKNWYMEKYIENARINQITFWICVVGLILGFGLALGGVLL
ncbi:MAG: NADH-quinone oxidoreductase subunit L [Oscillospiraceae bacterium]|nr:NADH-quinone oxidoreductase subunit L [Oscillospiraceae bacterium]